MERISRFHGDVAQPGDPDLDIYIEDVILDNVFVHDREIMVIGRGGLASWVSDGDHVQLDRVTEFECVMRLAKQTSEFFHAYVSQLESWRIEKVKLRFCGAENRPGSLIEDESRWLPIPRRPFPVDGEI